MNCISERSISCALAAVLLLYLPTASAQEDDFDHFSISLSVFLTDRAIKTRLNGSIGYGGLLFVKFNF